MTNTGQPRHLKGAPTGGQFAATTQPPAGIHLDEASEGAGIPTVTAENIDIAREALDDWDEASTIADAGEILEAISPYLDWDPPDQATEAFAVLKRAVKAYRDQAY